MAVIKIPAGSHGIVYVRVSTEHQASDESPDRQPGLRAHGRRRAGWGNLRCRPGRWHQRDGPRGEAGSPVDHLSCARGRAELLVGPRLEVQSLRPRTWRRAWSTAPSCASADRHPLFQGARARRPTRVVDHAHPHGGRRVLCGRHGRRRAPVQKELARQGFSAGGRPPVGYRREPVVIGARYDGTPLTRIRWVPDPETAPRVVQAFQMAAEGVTYDEIIAATGICGTSPAWPRSSPTRSIAASSVFNREARSRASTAASGGGTPRPRS